MTSSGRMNGKVAQTAAKPGVDAVRAHLIAHVTPAKVQLVSSPLTKCWLSMPTPRPAQMIAADSGRVSPSPRASAPNAAAYTPVPARHDVSNAHSGGRNVRSPATISRWKGLVAPDSESASGEGGAPAFPS